MHGLCSVCVVMFRDDLKNDNDYSQLSIIINYWSLWQFSTHLPHTCSCLKSCQHGCLSLHPQEVGTWNAFCSCDDVTRNKGGGPTHFASRCAFTPNIRANFRNIRHGLADGMTQPKPRNRANFDYGCCRPVSTQIGFPCSAAPMSHRRYRDDNEVDPEPLKSSLTRVSKRKESACASMASQGAA